MDGDELLHVHSTVERQSNSSQHTPRTRLQFSLRTLFLVMTAVALILGLVSSWPNHVASLKVPRIDAKPGLNDLTHTALTLDISQRWGTTIIRMEEEDGFNEDFKAELFWLESGEFRHLMLADKGELLTNKIIAPSERPLVFAVAVYHPKFLLVEQRRISSDNRVEGRSVTYGADRPPFSDGIENWGKKYLERIRENP